MMKSNEMQKGRLYVVTKSSSDHSIRKGETVWVDDLPLLKQKDVLFIQDKYGGGWIGEKEWNRECTGDFEVKEKPFFQPQKPEDNLFKRRSLRSLFLR